MFILLSVKSTVNSECHHTDHSFVVVVVNVAYVVGVVVVRFVVHASVGKSLWLPLRLPFVKWEKFSVRVIKL